VGYNRMQLTDSQSGHAATLPEAGLVDRCSLHVWPKEVLVGWAVDCIDRCTENECLPVKLSYGHDAARKATPCTHDSLVW
jgi:hypothetical protein